MTTHVSGLYEHWARKRSEPKGVHPLEELERHYIEVRRQVESGQLPASEGLRRVHERTVVDAAGVTWRVDTDPRRSTGIHAEFETVDRNNVATSANSSSFAFQPPSTQFSVSDIPQNFPQDIPQGIPQGIPQSTPPPVMHPGGFQLAQPGSFGPSPTIPAESPARRRREAADAAPAESKDKKAKKMKKKDKLPAGFASGSPLSRITGGLKNISFTPVTLGAIAVVFVLAVVAFLYFSSSSDTPASPTTTLQAPTSSTAPTDSTSSIPSDTTIPGTMTTTSVLSSDTSTTTPGGTSDTVATTMPGTPTIPGETTVPQTTAPLTPPATNSSGIPTR